MTFRKLNGPADDMLSSGPSSGRAEVLTPPMEGASLANRDQLSSESEESEMMLASLDDFELAEIAVRNAMAEYKF